MPPILSPKYPIYATVTANTEFTVLDAGMNIIFRGRADQTGQVDISNILQDYVNAEMVTIEDENLPDVQNGSLTRTYFVNSSAGLFTGVVSNNYNDQWIDQITEDTLVSDIIGDEVHPEQLVFVDALSPNGTGVINISGTNYPVNQSTSIATKTGEIYQLQITNQGIGTNGEMYGIAFGNNVFIGVGNNGTISKSFDGVNWITQNPFPSDFYVDVIFSNNIFVAIASAGGIIVSTDNGNTWVKTTTLNASLNKIVFGNGIFVISATGQNVFYSSDAQNWTSSPSGGSTYGAAFGNGIFILYGSSGRYIYGTNGQTWQTANSGSQFGMFAGTFSNNRFVFVGQSGNFSTTLTNGQTWTNDQTGTNSQLNDIIYGNNLFVSVYGGYYAVTSNGINWNYGIDTSQYFTRGIAFGNGIFVGVGSNGKWVIFDFVKVADETNISFNGTPIEFNISNGCERYAIYFVNRWGGRTSMIVKGYVRDGITYDSFRIRTQYDRLDPRAFETRTIRNNEYKTHTFNTSWLMDEDNDKIDDLISSPRVWIHDFETGEIKSAYISQSSFTNKRYRTDKVSNNQITVIEAQSHIRR